LGLVSNTANNIYMNYFFVICLFFQEQVYTYMIQYTQCFSTQHLQ
jgi:hypothetical protein